MILVVTGQADPGAIMLAVHATTGWQSQPSLAAILLQSSLLQPAVPQVE